MCALYLALKPLVLALQKGLFYTPIATAKKTEATTATESDFASLK